MELNLKGTSYIFIEESVLLKNGFFDKLKGYLLEAFKDPNNKIKIVMDENVNESVKNYLKNGMLKEAHLLDGIIDILKYYELFVGIDTNSYLDVSNIIDIMKEPKDAKRYFLTQKENVFNGLKNLKESFAIDIYRFEGDQFVKWKEKQVNLNAFYLENDNYIPKTNTQNIDYVYSPKYGYLRLDLESAKSGGEGSVYRTYNNFMAKIYLPDSITYVNYKKLEKMIDMKVYNPFVCWPKDLLYYNNEFVGYLMDEIKEATPLLTLRLQSFAEFNHLDRFILCYNLLKQIKYLHDKNILVGDLKPDNILVKSPEEVYFIDCGCYQIEDFACPVCHPEYTKRVFAKDELKKQLRTIEDEYYPINKMAFEILMLKNHTYSPTNMDIEAQDKNQFYYPLDVTNVKPETEDMAIWCFLTQPMREYFYYYFKEERITDLADWCNELKIFIENMKSLMKK